MSKTQSQKVFAEHHISARKSSVKGKNSANPRKTTGLITTQLLKEGSSNVPKSNVSNSKQNIDSNRASKISVYSENLQFETRTEDGRRTIGQPSAVLTDPKINLFSSQMGPPASRSNTMKREAAQNTNHQVRASRTPHSHKFKHHGVTSSLPASRRDQDSLIAGESNGHHRGSRPTLSTNSSRAQSLMSPKDTPKGGRTKKPPVPNHRTLEQFYSGAKDTRGAVNNLFSPVLSNMHKGGGVQVKPSPKVNDSQQTLKISSATKQKGTKLVSNRKKEMRSPSKHDILMAPVLSQTNSSMLGKTSPRRAGS